MEQRCPHENVESIGTCSDGCCDKYKCLDCGLVFIEESAD